MDVKVYCFNSPALLQINISKKHIVNDVIKHIITIYKRTPELFGKRPLRHEEPEGYELRLIDDDEEFYTPFMEISPLEKNQPIGEFDALALIEVRGFKSKNLTTP